MEHTQDQHRTSIAPYSTNIAPVQPPPAPPLRCRCPFKRRAAAPKQNGAAPIGCRAGTWRPGCLPAAARRRRPRRCCPGPAPSAAPAAAGEGGGGRASYRDLSPPYRGVSLPAMAHSAPLGLLEQGCPIQVEHDRKRRQFTVRLNGKGAQRALGWAPAPPRSPISPPRSPISPPRSAPCAAHRPFSNPPDPKSCPPSPSTHPWVPPTRGHPSRVGYRVGGTHLGCCCAFPAC